MKSLITKILLTFCVIYLPILLVSVFIPFYRYEFGLRGVYDNFEAFGVEKTEVNRRANEIVLYMHGAEMELDPEFFSQEDIWHMKDVRNILVVSDYLFVGGVFALMVLVVNFMNSNNKTVLPKILRNTGLIVLGVLFVSMIVVLTQFDWAFIGFHKLFFRNDYWLLDPATSNLIKFFPRDFFRDFVVLVIGGILALSAVVFWFSVRLGSIYRVSSVNSTKSPISNP